MSPSTADLSSSTPPDAAAWGCRHEASLRHVQRWSGVLMSLFVGAHLLNQATAACGPSVYTPLQRILRAVYQHPIVEVGLVISPMLVHVAVDVMLIWRRRRQPAPSSWRLRVHRVSGRVLGLFFVGHVIATRGPSLVFGVFPELEGIALTMIVRPEFFFPYYVLFGAAGVVHGVFGMALALPSIAGFRGLFAGRAVVVGSAVAAAAVVAGVLGFGGAFAPVDKDAVLRSPIAVLQRSLGLLPPLADSDDVHIGEGRR